MRLEKLPFDVVLLVECLAGQIYALETKQWRAVALGE